MTQIKLSEPQKILLDLMRRHQVKYYNGGWFEFVKGNKYVATVTAKSLLNKGIFTIGNDGICQLTELGLTIKL
jgi:hypothetical protein